MHVDAPPKAQISHVDATASTTAATDQQTRCLEALGDGHPSSHQQFFDNLNDLIASFQRSPDDASLPDDAEFSPVGTPETSSASPSSSHDLDLLNTFNLKSTMFNHHHLHNKHK